MTGASYILAINLFIAATFSLAFLVVGLSNRSDRAAPLFSLAYIFASLYVITEFVVPLQTHPQFAYTLGFVGFLGAMTCLTLGVARRYGRRVPPGAVIAFSLVCIAANWFAYDLGHDTVPRNLIYQAPYALLQAYAAWIVIASRRRSAVDVGLIVLFFLSAAQFLSKPFAALALGGSGDSASTYIATTYALYSQSLGAMLGVSTGLLMLSILVRDMLVEAMARSETDPLSGIYNRRGFEDRAEPGLQSRSLPASLVLADLDGFKSINDAYGHDVGDTVIVRFAKLLQQMAPKNAVVGRLGGEEFAIFLPETNASAARLLAESLRVAFGTGFVDGLAGRRCTASFGVAERDGEETLADLRRRADTALYAAKRDGRDRVVIAAGGNDAMPLHPLAGTSLSRSA
ncbi:MAG: diguanylate cyclase domain-containing protein [Devosia sp.]